MWGALLFAQLALEPSPALAAALAERVGAACRQMDEALTEDDAERVRWSVRVEQADSAESFARATRRARFEAAALVGHTLWLQAPEVLDRLPDVDGVLRHECVHALLRVYRVRPLDPIDEEAVAMVLSGQASRLPPAPPIEPHERAAISRALAAPRDRAGYERALARVARTLGPEVTRLARERRLVSALRSRGAVMAAAAPRAGSAR